jgi:allene oxide cyclase
MTHDSHSGTGLRLAAAMAFAAGVICLPAGAARAAEQLMLVEHMDSQNVTDMAPKGDSAGDNMTFANKLYDKDDKQLVGHDTGWCIRTVAGQVWECFRTYMLEQGQITVEGPYYDGKDSTFAITGGTGIYLTVQGELKMQARDASRREYNLTFTLIR